MPEEKYSEAKIEDLQEERKHLESLFADRINFYLVFAAGVMAFLFGDKHPKRLEQVALAAVILLSILMLFALWRTFRLVMSVLKEIAANPDEKRIPYAFYSKRATWVGNANYFLLALPVSLTGFFIYALMASLRGR